MKYYSFDTTCQARDLNPNLGVLRSRPYKLPFMEFPICTQARAYRCTPDIRKRTPCILVHVHGEEATVIQ